MLLSSSTYLIESVSDINPWLSGEEYSSQMYRYQTILAKDMMSRWDGTTTIITSDVRAVATQVQMPGAHDWH